MTGQIQNRQAFIGKISQKLKRSAVPSAIERPQWAYTPQYNVLRDKTQDELLEVLQKQCKLINTTCKVTPLADLQEAVYETIQSYGGGPIIAWQDERVQQYGLSDLFTERLPKEQVAVHIWDPAIGRENISLAETATIGITIAEQTLAESGTAVLLSHKNHGRTVSFLPEKSIILIPKSTIVPRMTQVAVDLRKRILQGEKVPSCINFISGPSNSADIEMILVVGVHGPMRMTYIVIDDL
ncbi:lactate utilization protein C [Neobacillus sp. MM2021_6]|uniref:LutC/YkgG family protein n=1 Tax=Bacillaceae TaxID=186817 RepID=UPI0014079319|nr:MULTISPECIES: lactate utilization protein C [Bacillaceae]MBO0958819.1 lactate utilization protein C [Neobacillus sp. MM2021_6]NHC20044.1 lactate utilization protein C [Bacillus sp. MM2020_4]